MECGRRKIEKDVRLRRRAQGKEHSAEGIAHRVDSVDRVYLIN